MSHDFSNVYALSNDLYNQTKTVPTDIEYITITDLVDRTVIFSDVSERRPDGCFLADMVVPIH